MDLYVEPRMVKSWNEFITQNPPFSIALDGYVFGKPMFDPSGPFANYNHHEEVDRLATRSTTGQVYVAIKQGLINAYAKKGKVACNIYVNDPDQDTCLAVWLLNNYERINGTKSEPLINRLVDIEDLLDTTGGSYPFDPNAKIMKQVAWVFEPYTTARQEGRLADMGRTEMELVIEAVGSRISKHVMGNGSEINPATKYIRLGGGQNWAMIKEIGAQARSALFHDGIMAYVAVREKQNGKYVYTIGKISPYINFPIESLYTIFNSEEGIGPQNPDRWNGGDIIGGSPRNSGSSLAPAELEKIINKVLQTQGSK